MTTEEREQQEKNPSKILDLTGNPINPCKFNSTSSKLNSLFEIQNTLDDTCLIENNNSVFIQLFNI